MTTLRRRLTGLAALLAILALLIGLPAVLLAVGANPFPAGIPSLADVVRALAAPDDGTLLLALIKIRQRAMTTEQGPFRDEVIILAEEGLKR